MHFKGGNTLMNLLMFPKDREANSKEFADDMKKTRLEKGEWIIFYDVSSLFTSIPVTSAIQIIKNKLD